MGNNANIPKGDGEKNQMADGEKNQMADDKNLHVSLNFQTKVYEKVWVPNWLKVRQREETLLSQTCEFRTGRSTQIQTKWSVFLDSRNGQENEFKVYWKLIEVTGFPEGKVEFTAESSLMNFDDDTVIWTRAENKTMTADKQFVVWNHLTFDSDPKASKSVFIINPFKKLGFKLKLTIEEPQLPSVYLKMEFFDDISAAQVCENFKNLLCDRDTADLIITTSDGAELFAHKAILQARCTVFDSMFRSDLSDSKTGAVIVKDVSSETMNILLRYFYTGSLLEYWKDEENVVEFTYAVGKYQLTNVLELLDEVLGNWNEKDATYTDVQLLDLVQKLGLKTAEKGLMERIKSATGKVKSGDELFALYGIGEGREMKTLDSNFKFLKL